jgi:hypothetical protein
LSTAVPLALLAALPYLLAGYTPSIVIDPVLSSFLVFGGTDMEGVFKVASFDAYSVWPLVTFLRHGVHGTARLQFPDSLEGVGPLTYHQIGVLAVLAVTGAVAVWLLVSRRVPKESGLIFAVLAFAVLAELVLPTRSIARYFLFPLAFALLALPTRPVLVGFAVAALAVTSFVGMYGSVASGLEPMPSLAPRLAPDSSVISRAALDLFRSDLMITVGSLLNLAALLVLAGVFWLPRPRRASFDTAWQPRLRGAFKEKAPAAY